MAYDAAQGGDPYKGLDVERVVAAVELLGRRRDLEVTPFVSAWHPAVDGWDRGNLPAFWDKTFARALTASSSNRARDTVVNLINAVTRGGTGEIYTRLQQQLVEQLVGLLSTTRKDVQYLVPLAEAGRATAGISVATLNYDLSVEQAGELVGVPVHTGISNWGVERDWGWPESGVRLLKLHGSIDWRWERADFEPGQMGHTSVRQVDAASTDSRDPVLVFGHGAKLRAEGPFLSLLAEFESQLAAADRLVVVGYSFRDDHVNEVIRRWTVEDSARCVVVIDPHFPQRGESPPREEFRGEMIHALRPEGWPEREFSPRLTVLRKPASEGIAEMFDDA
jgi:hypothetical protein